MCKVQPVDRHNRQLLPRLSHHGHAGSDHAFSRHQPATTMRPVPIPCHLPRRMPIQQAQRLGRLRMPIQQNHSRPYRRTTRSSWPSHKGVKHLKQYKSATPRETVRRIRRILKTAGIKTTAEFRDVNGIVHSCHIRIVNGHLDSVNLGTNGKGLSRDYALASGYAELMERLQTRFLYSDMLELPRRVFGHGRFSDLRFRFAPDEIELSPHPSTTLIHQFFPKSASKIHTLPRTRTFFADMQSLRDCRTIKAPIELMRWMTGSTGCCAGNTRSEAIAQGICEIIERHAVQMVYLQGHQGLPLISPKHFGPSDAINRLKKLTTAHGLMFSIRDCSFGSGLPVLGLLIWNKQRYQFKIGAATSPDVALSRCLTEIYQGCVADERLLPRDPRLMLSTPDNYQNAKLDGSGHWPSGIFTENGISTLCNFETFASCNLQNDCRKLVRMLMQRDLDIFVQDVSFLRFPSYYVYIPGLSDVHPELYDFAEEIRHRGNRKRLISDAWHPVGRRLQPESCSTPPRFNAAYRPSNYPPPLYQFALSLVRGDFNAAHGLFSKFLVQTPSARTTYNRAAEHYLRLLADGLSPLQTQAALIAEHDHVLVQQLTKDLTERQNLSSAFALPTCFNCAHCPTRSQCALDDIVSLDARLSARQYTWSKQSLTQ